MTNPINLLLFSPIPYGCCIVSSEGITCTQEVPLRKGSYPPTPIPDSDTAFCGEWSPYRLYTQLMLWSVVGMCWG